MTRVEFVAALRGKLCCLPEADVQKTVDYYSEIINDRMDEGESEEEAVAALGSIDDIAAKVLTESPAYERPGAGRKPVKRRRKVSAVEIILIALGFPVWFPILVTLAALALVFYILAWVLLFVLVIVVISLILGIFAGIVEGVIRGSLFYIGCGLACAGLAILSCLGVISLFKGFFHVHKLSLGPVGERIRGSFGKARESVRAFIDRHWM